jgi:DNA-binding NarL/FixJ family response regulator
MEHKHILIVDDSEIVRTATRHLLEDETEYEVCGEAVDGVDALEKARHLSPDLIILDLQMPGMNGLQTARELRAMRVSAPIILFTMYADAVRPDDALAAGISAVVAKTNLPALRQHVENLLVASCDWHV